MGKGRPKTTKHFQNSLIDSWAQGLGEKSEKGLSNPYGSGKMLTSNNTKDIIEVINSL